MRPLREVWAPVKAPWRWPKSSLSTSDSGMAPQFTGTKGPRARVLFSCTSRAKTSLPVPVSPVSSTVESLPAIFRHRRWSSSRGEPAA